MVALAIGIPVGTIAALKQNTALDYASMAIAVTGVSIPSIVSAPLLKYIFAVQLKWLPPNGWGGIEYIILPAFALGFIQSALIARLTRASLLQVLGEDYIRTARSKGLSERVVVGIHALKNSMIPVVTVIGPLAAALLTGTFVVETVFGIPGLGRSFVTSIGNRDYPLIMGRCIVASFVVVGNFIVELHTRCSTRYPLPIKTCMATGPQSTQDIIRLGERVKAKPVADAVKRLLSNKRPCSAHIVLCDPYPIVCGFLAPYKFDKQSFRCQHRSPWVKTLSHQ